MKIVKKQALLLGGGVGVLLLLGGLLLAMRDPAKKPSDTGPTTNGASGDRPPREPRAPRVVPSTDPTVPTGDNPPPVNVPWVGRRDADGNPIRDHRGDGQVSRTPNPISSETVSVLRNTVAPLVKQCAAALRDADPPQKGKLMLTFTAKTVGGRAFASASQVRLIEVASDELTSCVKKAVDEIVVDAAPGQIDGERAIVLQFTVP